MAKFKVHLVLHYYDLMVEAVDVEELRDKLDRLDIAWTLWTDEQREPDQVRIEDYVQVTAGVASKALRQDLAEEQAVLRQLASSEDLLHTPQGLEGLRAIQAALVGDKVEVLLNLHGNRHLDGIERARLHRDLDRLIDALQGREARDRP